MNKAREVLASFKARSDGCFGLQGAGPSEFDRGAHRLYEGFVLPAAIGFSCWVGIAPRKDRKLVLYSGNLGKT